jgi:hypothetical protein
MGAANTAEISQMHAITSLAYIIEGLALREMKQNKILNCVKPA